MKEDKRQWERTLLGQAEGVGTSLENWYICGH